MDVHGNYQQIRHQHMHSRLPMAMLQWPQPLSLTGSLSQPCIYGLSASLGLKFEILRLSIGFESLELAWLNLELKLASMGRQHELLQ